MLVVLNLRSRQIAGPLRSPLKIAANFNGSPKSALQSWCMSQLMVFLNSLEVGDLYSDSQPQSYPYIINKLYI